METQNRKRNIQILFRVTPEEKGLIQEKMCLACIDKFEAYAREMAVKGYIIIPDHSDIKNQAAEFQKITVNINQFLKHMDAKGAAYAADAEEIRQKLKSCWQMERKLFQEVIQF